MGNLYEKIGFNKEILSRGRFAELLVAEQRPFRLFIMHSVNNKAYTPINIGYLDIILHEMFKHLPYNKGHSVALVVEVFQF